MLSHECMYIGCHRDLPEEDRALAVWEAPWALLMLDDSPGGGLEYANKQVRMGRLCMRCMGRTHWGHGAMEMRRVPCTHVCTHHAASSSVA